MSTSNAAPSRLEARQFGLAGMLSVVSGCAVYFGFLRNTGDYLTILEHADRFAGSENRWLPPLSVFASWLAVWAVYCYWKLGPAMKIHYAGPLIFTPIILLVSLLSGLHSSAIPLVFTYGFFASVLFGFPTVAIMLFARFVRRT